MKPAETVGKTYPADGKSLANGVVCQATEKESAPVMSSHTCTLALPKVVSSLVIITTQGRLETRKAQ